jgi:hypothetical protein
LSSIKKTKHSSSSSSSRNSSSISIWRGYERPGQGFINAACQESSSITGLQSLHRSCCGGATVLLPLAVLHAALLSGVCITLHLELLVDAAEVVKQPERAAWFRMRCVFKLLVKILFLWYLKLCSAATAGRPCTLRCSTVQ